MRPLGAIAPVVKVSIREGNGGGRGRMNSGESRENREREVHENKCPGNVVCFDGEVVNEES